MALMQESMCWLLNQLQPGCLPKVPFARAAVHWHEGHSKRSLHWFLNHNDLHAAFRIAVATPMTISEMIYSP
jgi:hypothetical protein